MVTLKSNISAEIFIEADKKVNLLNSALSGNILKIFPVPNDKNYKWASFLEINHKTGTDLDKIKDALPFYLDALAKATKSKNMLPAILWKLSASVVSVWQPV